MLHAVAVVCPALVVNVPSAFVPHVISLVAVALAVMCWPAGHGERTGVHADPSILFENVAPTVHGSHWRSVVAVPCLDIPWPIPQVCHAVHVGKAGAPLTCVPPPK